MDILCPLCKSGTLLETTYSEVHEHEGYRITVHGLHSFLCEHCGKSPVFPKQVRINNQKITKAKLSVDKHKDGMEEISKILESTIIRNQDV